MKTSNVKLRMKDIRAGVTFYSAHPVYGIQKFVATSLPYKNKRTNSFFVDVINKFGWGSRISLMDHGINPPYYNGRRSFKKLKQAERWMEIWGKDKDFIFSQERHEEMIEGMLADEFYDIMD